MAPLHPKYSRQAGRCFQVPASHLPHRHVAAWPRFFSTRRGFIVVAPTGPVKKLAFAGSRYLTCRILPR